MCKLLPHLRGLQVCPLPCVLVEVCRKTSRSTKAKLFIVRSEVVLVSSKQQAQSVAWHASETKAGQLLVLPHWTLDGCLLCRKLWLLPRKQDKAGLFHLILSRRTKQLALVFGYSLATTYSAYFSALHPFKCTKWCKSLKP